MPTPNTPSSAHPLAPHSSCPTAARHEAESPDRRAPARSDGPGGQRESWQRLDLDRKYGWEVFDDGRPTVARVGGTVHLPARRAKVDATFIERVDGHGIAQYVYVAVLLRQPLGQRFPFVAAGFAAVDTQLAVEGEVFSIALDGHDVDGFRFVGVDVDHETEVGRQIATDFFPGITRVVAAHHVPVFLHEEDVRIRGMHGNVMNAVADFGGWFGNVL